MAKLRGSTKQLAIAEPAEQQARNATTQVRAYLKRVAGHPSSSVRPCKFPAPPAIMRGGGQVFWPPSANRKKTNERKDEKRVRAQMGHEGERLQLCAHQILFSTLCRSSVVVHKHQLEWAEFVQIKSRNWLHAELPASCRGRVHLIQEQFSVGLIAELAGIVKGAAPPPRARSEQLSPGVHGAGMMAP